MFTSVGTWMNTLRRKDRVDSIPDGLALSIKAEEKRRSLNSDVIDTIDIQKNDDKVEENVDLMDPTSC